jgi:hypothetical protein
MAPFVEIDGWVPADGVGAFKKIGNGGGVDPRVWLRYRSPGLPRIGVKPATMRLMDAAGL